MISAMERTPKMTQLKLGKIIDPSLRRRHEQATMANRDLLRQQRVAAGATDTRKAAGRQVDWAAEARSVAESLPYEYGVPVEAESSEARQQKYSVYGSPLWKAAKEEERAAVLSAFQTNTKVTSLVLVNGFITDALAAAHLAALLQSNSTLTSINLESNHISSAGIEAIAAGLDANTTLTELKLANQGIAFSQVRRWLRRRV